MTSKESTLTASIRRGIGSSGRVPDRAVALGIAVASMLLYLPTMSSSAVSGDGGEFQLVSQALGVAHSTGYPLLTLLGWIFGHLPLGGDAAYRVSLLGAIAISLAMAMLYFLERDLDISPIPALAAALLAASSTRLWQHATAAETPPLTIFFMVLCWWLLIRWSKGGTPLWLVALAFGFALTHHISIRLLAPAAFIFVLSVEPRLILQPRRWIPAMVCLLLPLLLYLYIPISAAYYNSLPQWSGEILGVRKTVASGLVSPHYYVQGAAGLIMAGDYTQQFLTGQSAANWSKSFAQYGGMIRDQFPLLVLPVVFVGIVALLRRNWRASLLFILSLVVILPAAISYLARVGEDGKHFIPSYLLMAIWFAAGADAISAWGAQRFKGQAWAVAVNTVLLLLVVVNIVTHGSTALASRQIDRSAAILDSALPQGAVLAGEWSIITPLRYHQRVDQQRSDLWVIHADAPGARLLMQRAMAEGVPFYVLRRTASGTRLLPLPAPADQPITHPADGRLGQSLRWRGYDLDSQTYAPGDEVPLTLYWQPTAALDRNWKTFIHLLDANGEKVAQVDRVPLGEYLPPNEWQPGMLLADQYELPLPSDLAPGSYRLIFGLYDGAERLTWEDGSNARTLAEITVSSP